MSTRIRLLVALGIAALTAAAMAPGLGGQLLNWDDDRFVEDNPIVHGLSLSNVKAIFAKPHQEAYHPLHLLSYTVDHALYGLWAPGYKIHNLLLYLLSLLLLYRLLLRLDLAPAAALAGVLVFAVHPLHVEVVVWISARKEPLSLCFMLGAALLHLSSTSWRDWRRGAALLLFGLALLTKTSTVVLPLLLLALELLQRRRRLSSSLLGVAPMLLLALGVGLYVMGLWQESEMVRPRPQSLGGGVALVLESIGHHLGKLLLPIRLSPVYPIDRAGSFGLTAGLGLAGLLGLGLLLWRVRPARLAVAWLLLSLLPVINLVPVYFFVQDRYAFIPSVALALGVAAAVEATGRDRMAVGAAIAVAALLAVLSGLQASHWRTSRALWEHAVRVQPGSYYAHLAQGHTRRRDGEPAAALQSYRAAIELQPGFPAARIALCLADADRIASRTGKKSAADRIQQQLQHWWASAPALLDLSGQLIQRSQLTCAVLAESRAFELQTPDPGHRIIAASRWTLAGQPQLALRHLSSVDADGLPAALRAAHAEVQAQALLLLGRRPEADAAFARSLQLAPRSAQSLESAAHKLEHHGRHELARFYREHARD